MIKKGKKLNRSRGGNALVFMFLFVTGIFIALPFFFTILQSIKPVDELFTFPPRFYVVRPTLDNYFTLNRLSSNMVIPLSRYLFNSVSISILVTTLHVLLASIAAFPLAKYKFPGSQFLNVIVVTSLLFTYEVTALPLYVTMSGMRLINTQWSIIFPSVATPLGLFLMRQFMSVIPDAMLEAADMDGASIFTKFWHVAMPQAKPAWMTLMIFAFQGIWNREGVEYIFDEQLKVLPTILRQLTAGGIYRAGAAAAVSVLLMLPPVIIFAFSQSKVIETMAYSGIKE